VSYYFATRISGTFDDALDRVREALQTEGFGVITEIDIQKTLNDKIGVNFRPYRILGACNPKLAFEALQIEDKVGTMLPCNVVVQQVDGGIEVAAIDPVASMESIENDELADKAKMVADKLRRVIDRLGGHAISDADAHTQQIEREAEHSRRELESIPPHGTDPLNEGP
jgi:uncharacterized protein (DUF302 family)